MLFQRAYARVGGDCRLSVWTVRSKRDIVQNIFSVLLKSFAWIFIRVFCSFIKSASNIIRSCLSGSLERINRLGIICAPVMFCWCVSLWCFLMDVFVSFVRWWWWLCVRSLHTITEDQVAGVHIDNIEMVGRFIGVVFNE